MARSILTCFITNRPALALSVMDFSAIISAVATSPCGSAPSWPALSQTFIILAHPVTAFPDLTRSVIAPFILAYFILARPVLSRSVLIRPIVARSTSNRSATATPS